MKHTIFVVANDYLIAVYFDKHLPSWLRKSCFWLGCHLDNSASCGLIAKLDRILKGSRPNTGMDNEALA